MDILFKKENVEEVLSEESNSLGLSAEEQAVIAKVLPRLTAKITAQAEANKAVEITKLMADVEAENKKLITEKLEELQKSLTPPTPEELQAMLSQEYLEVPLKIRTGKGFEDFTIVELPLETETKIVKTLQKTLSERMVEISRIDWTTSMTMLDRVEKLMSMVPGMLETISDCCALCLDPYGEREWMTGAWVRSNIGASRLLAIVHAQVRVGRYRDFLSLASRFFPGTVNR